MWGSTLECMPQCWVNWRFSPGSSLCPEENVSGATMGTERQDWPQDSQEESDTCRLFLLKQLGCQTSVTHVVPLWWVFICSLHFFKQRSWSGSGRYVNTQQGSLVVGAERCCNSASCFLFPALFSFQDLSQVLPHFYLTNLKKKKMKTQLPVLKEINIW